MRDRPDGRSVFAALCGVFALPVSVNPFFPLVFGPVGVLAAVASIAGDAPANRRTRILALVAAVVCIAFFAAGLRAVLEHPQLPGT